VNSPITEYRKSEQEDNRLLLESLRESIRKNDKVYSSYLFNRLKDYIEKYKNLKTNEFPEECELIEKISLFLYHIQLHIYPSSELFSISNTVALRVVFNKFLDIVNDISKSIQTLLNNIVFKFYDATFMDHKILGTDTNQESISIFVRFTTNNTKTNRYTSLFSPAEYHIDLEFYFFIGTDDFVKTTRFDIEGDLVTSLKRISMGTVKKCTYTKGRANFTLAPKLYIKNYDFINVKQFVLTNLIDWIKSSVQDNNEILKRLQDDNRNHLNLLNEQDSLMETNHQFTEYLYDEEPEEDNEIN
jgi:hypothetical protein